MRRSLEERARARGMTLSQTVRDILMDALAERPLGAKTGHLRGKLVLREGQEESWRKVLRERSWRP